jgi:EAL domain-containing protein (putative c-di-GMP-specific phosphodiesterase class I)
VALPERQPVGVEAVLRWRHPALGKVAATEFLPIAEDLGLVDEIGDWTLGRGLRQLSSWLRGGWDLWLSINVSASQLAQASFVGAFTAVLDMHQLPAFRVVVGVAEAGLQSGRAGGVDPGADTRARAVAVHLAELRILGVRAALDQFGTHGTPLSQLRMLPLDRVTLDRQLFDDWAGRTGPAPAIVDAVVSFAHQFGIEVAAQGLETKADVDAAISAGCQLGQGDVFCRALPPEHVEAYLDQHRSSRF